MKTHFFSLLFLVLMLGALMHFCGCATVQTPPPPPVDYWNKCVALCDKGSALGCDWAQPTKDGLPCVTVCSMVEEGPLKWNLDCIGYTTCADTESCVTQ